MQEIIKQQMPAHNAKKPNQVFRFAHIYRDNILLVSVVVLIFAIVICGYYHYQRDIKTSYKNLTALQKILVAQESKLSVLKSAKVDLSQMEESVKKLYAALPYDPDLPNLYLQIIEIVKKNNLTLTSFNANLLKQEQSLNKIKTIELNLNLDGGDYFALKKFVSDSTTSLRLMDIKALTYSPESKSYVAVLRAYYLSEN